MAEVEFRKISIFIYFHLCYGTIATVVVTSEARLHNDLFQNGSSKQSFPAVNSRVLVTIGLTLSQLVDVEELNEAVVVNAWIRQSWANNDTKWSPASYGNITRINVHPDYVWTPDIFSYDNVDPDKSFNGLLDTIKTSIEVHHNGAHKWNLPIILRVSCTINVKEFPFDTQRCLLRFGSFVNSDDRLEIVGERDSADLSLYTENSEWKLISMNCSQKLIKYGRSEKPFYEVRYELVVKRKPLFLLVNLLLPNVILSCLTVVVYLAPITSGERASFVVSLLLAMALFLTSAFDLMPDSSEAIPFFTYFLGTTLLAMFLLLSSLCFTISLYHANAKVTEMPAWLRKHVLETLVPYLGIICPQKTRHKKVPIPTFHVESVPSFGLNSTLPPNHIGRLWCAKEIPTKNFHQNFQEKFKDMTSSQLLIETTIMVSWLAENLERANHTRKLQQEWRLVALALDKLSLYLFSSIYTLILVSFTWRALQL